MLMADADAFPSSFFYPNAPRGGAGSLVFFKKPLSSFQAPLMSQRSRVLIPYIASSSIFPPHFWSESSSLFHTVSLINAPPPSPFFCRHFLIQQQFLPRFLGASGDDSEFFLWVLWENESLYSPKWNKLFFKPFAHLALLLLF